MSAVVNLASYRKPKLVPQPKPSTEPRWFCTNCDGETFRILASGDIHCVGCNRRITTIKAVRT